jgi:hypothetical protein
VTLAPSSAGNAPGKKGVVPHRSSADFALGLAVSLIGLAVLIVLVLALLGLRKRRRVRRRQRGDPRRRVVGAWQETLDVLVESGMRDPSALTSAEVADATAAAFGAQPAVNARYLGDCANLAIFSPGTPIAGQDADAAWAAHAELRRAVHGRLPWPQRVAARLRYPRPARRRDGSGPGTGAAGRRTATPLRTGSRRAYRRRTH